MRSMFAHNKAIDIFRDVGKVKNDRNDLSNFE